MSTLLLAWLAAANPAHAREKVEPVTGTVTVLAASEPLGIDRPLLLEEARDPEAPVVVTAEAQKAYDKQRDAYLDFRVDFKAIDAELASLAPAIAHCATLAGVAVGATTAAKITVATTGKVSRVATDKAADVGLATCVRTALEKRDTGAFLHGMDRTATWTFSLHAAPPGVPSAIDAATGVAGLAFGAAADALDNRANSASHGNVSHYYRTNDADVELAGVNVGIAFSFHPDFGFYAARVRATGDTATFAVREHTTERLGAPKWDGRLKCWYWRGERLVYVFEGARGSPVGQLMILDIARARKANVVSFLPGDGQGAELAPGEKLPKVLMDDADGD